MFAALKDITPNIIHATFPGVPNRNPRFLLLPR